MTALRRGAAAWWRLGPVAGTRAAVRAAVRIARAPARRARLRVAPLRARPREVREALGGAAVAALRGPALAALPAVADLERRLDGYGEEERRSLLERADAICAHRFDLLGSGLVDLGPEIDWRTDFKTGRRWPLAHISQVPIVFGDGSDIKVPWELCRFQHLPLLAAAHRLTGEARYLDEIGAQLDSFIAGNPVELGPNWACTMDVAIRASNWVAALALVAEARPGWLDRAVASLLLHGRFIRSHLEWGETRGNHYLSDIAGLLPVAALFSGGREGRSWMAWGAPALAGEMDHQVRPDGTDHEASIPYHRLVTELFVAGTAAVDSQLPDAFTPAYREQLEAMLRFTAAYTRPDGDAPMVGDNDSGRFLPLDGYGDGYRSHAHLLDGRPAAEGHAAFPDGGYWVLRGGDLWALVRCGDVGLNGLGGHAHNDALSFELSVGDQPLVVDPGTFVYTPDAGERNRFRSTAWHSTLQVGDEEQNPLRSDYLFAMDDRRRARALEWAPGADGRAVFAGRHEGFPGATHERRFEFDGSAGTLTLHDTVHGADGRTLTWTFPLPPGARVRTSAGEAVAEIGAARLTIRGEGLDFAVEDGWYAPVYGVREPAPFVRARRAGGDAQRITLSTAAQ
ncbi:MAG TPA: alginate lyase family protein [Solirubrobacteraceae bacterium]|nr:alginate lyase family protein [Solirubrobacteraceae bacterium]